MDYNKLSICIIPDQEKSGKLSWNLNDSGEDTEQVILPLLFFGVVSVDVTPLLTCLTLSLAMNFSSTFPFTTTCHNFIRLHTGHS